MTSAEIRKRFLAFFEKRAHAVLPSAPLVPENDPTVLFNTAGMQPLVPFLMGEKHPNGDKLVNVQKCVRTTDIEDIGDKTHATFFEMLGNWSLGSYFKEEAIKWSFDFLTSKEEGLGLDPNRLYVTVFEGDANAPRDEESVAIWQKVGIPKSRIYYKGVDANWWPAVKGKDTWTGPTGPNTEMFYDLTGTLGELETNADFEKADSEQKIVEIWNDVFMEYEKKDGLIVSKLKKQNVDTGAGLERIAMIMQGVDSIFETDLLKPLVQKIRSSAQEQSMKAERIIADHIRTSVFLISDGVTPSNTDQGYVLRRLIRRAIRFADIMKIEPGKISEIASVVPAMYSSAYINLAPQIEKITQVIAEEEQKFRKTLSLGLKQFEKVVKNHIIHVPTIYFNKKTGESHTKEEVKTSDRNELPASVVFDLFQTFGFPIELTTEIALEKEIYINQDAVAAEMVKHAELSRSGSEQRFKGGLADTSEMSVKYHTATHLLNAALKKVLGRHVDQKGSNITPERLRFDFVHDKKMTDEEKKKVEDLINEQIKADLPVSYTEMPLAQAREIGAVGVFGEKYADTVRVYSIGEKGNYFSQEICGGPHVEHTAVLGTFKIAKEEAVSAGVRRIKATLE